MRDKRIRLLFQVMKAMCKQGYKDALHFLKRNGKSFPELSSLYLIDLFILFLSFDRKIAVCTYDISLIRYHTRPVTKSSNQ